MTIILKNGKKINLEWSLLVLEYLDDYEGGYEALIEEVKNSQSIMFACNQIVYAVISANYDEPITYRQAISLVNVNDTQKIIDFVIENASQITGTEKITPIKRRSHRI